MDRVNTKPNPWSGGQAVPKNEYVETVHVLHAKLKRQAMHHLHITFANETPAMR